MYKLSPSPSGLPLVAAQNSALQIPPVTTPGALLQVIAFVAVGGESSVSETVIRSPLMLAPAPRRSTPGHAGFATPSSSYVSPARSVTEWSWIGQLFMRLIVWFLKTLTPESCRENLFRVSLPRVVLSSAQTTLAAPRWSMSTVKKSSRSRSPEHARPAVQMPPRWFGWSLIWTLLKFEPVFSALSDWAKYTFQTIGLPFASKPTLELSPLVAL